MHSVCDGLSRYWQLSLEKVPAVNKKEMWDRGVAEASEVYKGRMVGYTASSYANLGSKLIDCAK